MIPPDGLCTLGKLPLNANTAKHVALIATSSIIVYRVNRGRTRSIITVFSPRTAFFVAIRIARAAFRHCNSRMDGHLAIGLAPPRRCAEFTAAGRHPWQTHAWPSWASLSNLAYRSPVSHFLREVDLPHAQYFHR